MGRVLVTGGAGFIGSHLVPALARGGHGVRILDTLSPQVHGALPEGFGWLAEAGAELRRGSVADAAEVDAAIEGVDAVIHLAAETGTGQSMYEIARYCGANVQGTAVLMDRLAAGSHSVRRLVLASSRSVYGEGAYLRRDEPDGPRIVPRARSAEALRSRLWDPVCPETGAPLVAVPTREDDRTAPASIYAATKLMQEDLVRIAGDAGGLGWAILRLQNVYGEGQSLRNPYTGILSVFSTRLRRGLDLPIFEDGAESRDFVHVSDVVAAIVAALEAPESPSTIVNVGSGLSTSVAGVARALARAFGAEPRLRVTGQFRLGDIRHSVADVARLRHRLGVAPKVGLEEGLSRFAAWVDAQALPEDRLDAANAELARRRMMG